jgi:ATP-dependent Lon protease
MITAITELRQIASQFGDAVGVMTNAACQSALTGLPLRLPPILLLGQPGIGKTFFGRRLAAALGTMLISLPMNLTPAFGLMAGLSPAWRGAAPGKIATTLLASPTTSPLILFDEIDKVVFAGANDRPLDVLHSL